jgi:WD40 repeat protein
VSHLRSTPVSSRSRLGWAAAALVVCLASGVASAGQPALVVQRSHGYPPQFLRISADARWAATGDFLDLGLNVWNLVDGALVATIPVHVAACDFSADGRLLVVASGYLGSEPEVWLYRTDSLDGPPVAHKVLEQRREVVDVGFFPNGGDVAITGGSKVSVWKDAARDGPIVLVSDHEKGVPVHLTGHALAFSADGSRWLAGRTVWTGDSFAPVATIDSAGQPAGISPDGELVYVLLPDRKLPYLSALGTFSLARHAVVATYRPPRAQLQRNLKSVDVSRDGTVYVWNEDNAVRGTLFQLGKRDGRVFASNGHMVGLAAGPRRFAFFRDSGMHLASLDGGAERVLSGATALGGRVAIADAPPRLAVEIGNSQKEKESNRAVITLDLGSGALLGRFQVPFDNNDHLSIGITDAGATRDSGGRMFMTRWGGVTVFDVARPRPVARWDFYQPDTAGLAPDGGVLYVRDEGGRSDAQPVAPRTAVWDLATLRPLRFSAREARHLSGGEMTLTPDGKWMLLCTQEGATLWDVRNDRSAATLIAPKAPDNDTFEALWMRESVAELSRDGRYAACAGRARMPTIWEVAKRRVVWTAMSLGPEVESLESLKVGFLAEGRFVAITSNRSRTVLLELPSGKPVPLPDGARLVTAAPDGRTIAASLDDGVILVDAVSGAQQARWPRSKRAVQDLVLSPDGNALLEETQGDAPFWLATRAAPTAGAPPSWSAGELAQHRKGFFHSTATRFVAGGKVLLVVTDRIVLYRVRDRATLEVVYDERPRGKGAIVTIASDGRFDGPPGSLDILRVHGDGGHLVAASASTPGYAPGLQQQWMAAAAGP